MTRRVYRGARCRMVLTGFAGVLTAGALWSAMRTGNPGSKLFLVLFAAFWGYLAFRYWLMGVVVERSGVTVWNATKSHRLSWGEIQEFEFVLVGSKRRYGRIRLRDGTELWLDTCAYFSGNAREVVNELNRDLAEARRET